MLHISGESLLLCQSIVHYLFIDRIISLANFPLPIFFLLLSFKMQFLSSQVKVRVF